MSIDSLVQQTRSQAREQNYDAALAAIVSYFGAQSGTIHLLAGDHLLHLKAATANIPPPVIETVRTVPVGKGMAGLAAERNEPVTACNLQTDTSGDVRPGAKITGLQGSIVVPIQQDGRAVGSLGVANFHERTFTEQEIADLLRVGRALVAE